MDWIMDWIMDNWELIPLVLAGGWLAKIRMVIGDFRAVVKELGETRDKLEAALAGDKEITKEEMEGIAKEMQEDLMAIHKLSASAMSIIPEKFRSKLPFKTKG